MLANFLEILGQKSIIRRFNVIQRPRTPEERQRNIQACLLHLVEQKILSDSSTPLLAEKLLQKDEETILALIWRLLSRYLFHPLFPRRLQLNFSIPPGLIFRSWLQRRFSKEELSLDSIVNGILFVKFCEFLKPSLCPIVVRLSYFSPALVVPQFPVRRFNLQF